MENATESGQAAPNTVSAFAGYGLSPGGGRLRFYRATPVRGGAWGDDNNTVRVHTQAYVVLF
jgi:hypothetical protein